MNLVCFALQRTDSAGRSGTHRAHQVGNARFDFIAGHEAVFGSYEACSLFSPMFEFADPAVAAATALAVLAALREPAVPALPRQQQPEAALAARRGFLFGRRPAAGDAP